MADPAAKKRSAPADSQGSSDRKQKRKKLWRAPNSNLSARSTIESGDAGIFVTCDRGREGKCTGEVLDLLNQEVQEINPSAESKQEESSTAREYADDIEAQIREEVESMKPKKSRALFQAVKLDVPCLLFIKVDQSIDPVDLVHRICVSAHEAPEKKRSRFVKRLTPVTSTRKILSGGGIEELCREVLEPHFHSEDGLSKKYAIRPTVRNNHDWPRDVLIPLVARAVGQGHTVDLKGYDALILVEILQNICGMSVVPGDYEGLKRYNLAEIYNPTPRPGPGPQRQEQQRQEELTASQNTPDNTKTD